MKQYRIPFNLSFLFGLASLFCMSAISMAGDPYAGEVKAQVCLTCHGAGDETTGVATPIISGQYEDYIAHSLRAYKSGERNNPIMAGFATQLSESDIRDIAAYYAKMESSLFTPEE